MADRKLTEGRLLEAAGDVIFGRGEDYVRHVRGLLVMGTCATGTVQAQNAYVVELDWGKRDLDADCSCPHFARGFFCKHVVALGLAALQGRAPLSLVGPSGDPDLRDYLQTLEAGELRDLVEELAAREDAVGQLLRVRAAVSGANGFEASKVLTQSVTTALNVRGFIDYRRSFEVAFDERGLRAYRQAVDKLDEKYAGVDHWKRFEIDRMLLELADHDGDVDRAIAVLEREEHPEYGGIVDRLRAAGRDVEALAWTDRAVAEERISSSHGKGSYWLDPAEVAASYVDVGRDGDAVGVLRGNFAKSAGLASLQLLLRFAGQLGIGESEREWALA